ncbi:MAG: hypothetical protein KDB14_33025 [Planctomycetales bacterium]|nr:hypothetical protein [Planctomycetales bacterium]
MVNQPSPPSLRDQHLEQHERNARLLEKIEQQFGKLESKLELLEQTMIDRGWMIDPALEQRERRAAAKVGRASIAVDSCEARWTGHTEDTVDDDATMDTADGSIPEVRVEGDEVGDEGAPPRRRGGGHTRSLRSRKPR